jgi:hypothetical protein
MRKSFLLAPLLLAPILGVAPATQPTTQPVHDRDPWIFRCVLDGNARIVVVSLGNHRWAAYDAAHCALAKFWEGDVDLTGAVYDMRHGPQPKAKGKILLDRSAPITSPGQVITGLATNLGQNATAPVTTPPPDTEFWTFAYRGYSQKDGLATFRFTHGDGDGQVRIDETPTTLVSPDGATVLRRSFSAWDASKPATQPRAAISLSTSTSVAKLTLVSGDIVVSQGVGHASTPLKAPAEIPFDATKNVDISLASSDVVIDTEFKPADQQTAVPTK